MVQSEQAVAEWQCARLIHEFAHLNDAREYEKLAALFTVDGIFVRPSTPDDVLSGRDTILAHFRSRPPRFTRHVVSNILVSVESRDCASARSYLILYSAPLDVEPGAVRRADTDARHGEFRDRFARVDGRWYFRERLGTLTLIG